MTTATRSIWSIALQTQTGLNAFYCFSFPRRVQQESWEGETIMKCEHLCRRVLHVCAALKVSASYFYCAIFGWSWRGYHLQSCRACKISGHYHWEPIMPLAKQQDANTSIQIRTTPCTFELTQTLAHNLILAHHAAELKYTAFISIVNKSQSWGDVWKKEVRIHISCVRFSCCPRNETYLRYSKII